MQTQPDHLDPYLSTSADTRVILFNIFEGLVKPDKDGNLQPAVAESSTVSGDALTYTFRLRKGIRFQNGKNVTVQDVKYSLDTAAGLAVWGVINLLEGYGSDNPGANGQVHREATAE